MKKRLFLRKSGPDTLTEELVAVFSGSSAIYEFKPLFTLVYGNLRARSAAHGGEEMLRLRLYEKLQSLVQAGSVDRAGKTYRGNSAKLQPLIDQIAAKHCRTLLEVAETAAPGLALEEERGSSPLATKTPRFSSRTL
ncbi:MAG TPA: hypothetical protein VK961_26300 [Chthoniobacter sp.]|nr:hypothetical protein [Chthoniobacter sp.]